MKASIHGIAVTVLVAAVCAGLLSQLDSATRERIEHNRSAVLLARLDELLPGEHYDNDPASDRIELHDDALALDRSSVTVYRARLGGEPVAAILQTTAANGYNGYIELLIAIRNDGRLAGARVLSQHETPGIGDRIEATRSGWLRGLAGGNLQRDWRLKADGGEIDQISGATITSRAVVVALQRALEFHQRQHTALYAPAPGGA